MHVYHYAAGSFVLVGAPLSLVAPPPPVPPEDDEELFFFFQGQLTLNLNRSARAKSSFESIALILPILFNYWADDIPKIITRTQSCILPDIVYRDCVYNN